MGIVRLVLFWDGQFWVRVANRFEDQRVQVVRVVFGREPTDAQVLDFVQQHWSNLQFSQPSPADNAPAPLAKNSKRRQREAARALQQRGISTKSQEILSRERETRKDARISARAETTHRKNMMRWEQKCIKKKEKHRGH